MAADRIDLLVSLGSLLKEAEARGERAAVQTLHDAMEAIVEAQGLASLVARRRKSDRERKKGVRSTDSTDSAESGVSVESMDVRGFHRNGGPPSPQVSLLPPTPPNNSSSPPSPPSSSSAPSTESDEGRAEQALLARLPATGTDVALRFLGLAAADATARISYVGRLGALLDKPPHFTAEELVEGLESMMTKVPRAEWGPSYLRAWVKRVRTDATRDAAKDAERGFRANGASADDAGAGAVFAKIRGLINTASVAGQPSRKFIRRADVEALGPRVLTAYDNIGGAERFLDPDEQVGFVLRDFTREYGTLHGAAP